MSLLKRPMATADVMIESLMRHYGDLRLAALPERHGEIEQLRREIARLVVKGEAGIEGLANATGTSVRTLQRRLKDAGVNYNDLQNEVRKTLALNLLENEQLALGEIAFSLGYSVWAMRNAPDRPFALAALILSSLAALGVALLLAYALSVVVSLYT